MKRVIIFGGLIFMLGVGMISCYKDVILPNTATTAPPQYEFIQ